MKEFLKTSLKKMLMSLGVGIVSFSSIEARMSIDSNNKDDLLLLIPSPEPSPITCDDSEDWVIEVLSGTSIGSFVSIFAEVETGSLDMASAEDEGASTEYEIDGVINDLIDDLRRNRFPENLTPDEMKDRLREFLNDQMKEACAHLEGIQKSFCESYFKSYIASLKGLSEAWPCFTSLCKLFNRVIRILKWLDENKEIWDLDGNGKLSFEELRALLKESMGAEDALKESSYCCICARRRLLRLKEFFEHLTGFREQAQCLANLL